MSKKSIEALQFPDDRQYHPEHTWAKKEEQLVIVGITDYAQDQLGDIVYIDISSCGEVFQAGDSFGQAESVKSVSALHMPVAGKVVEVNSKLDDTPELVNQDPFGEGWMIKVEIDPEDERKHLLTRDGYIRLLEEKQA